MPYRLHAAKHVICYRKQPLHYPASCTLLWAVNFLKRKAGISLMSCILPVYDSFGFHRKHTMLYFLIR